MTYDDILIRRFKMTVKKTNAKVSAKTIGMTEQEILAQEVGQLVGQRDTINATMDIKCKQINKLRKGKPIGTQASDCAVMKRFLESQIARGLSENTIKNNCTTFRNAVNNGKAYDVNASRKASKAKGSQAGKAKVATTGVKFKGDAKLEDVVKGLRNMFNKFKENDKTTSLASYLIDALDDFEGDQK
jgi:hypothetical protein